MAPAEGKSCSTDCTPPLQEVPSSSSLLNFNMHSSHQGVYSLVTIRSQLELGHRISWQVLLMEEAHVSDGETPTHTLRSLFKFTRDWNTQFRSQLDSYRLEVYRLDSRHWPTFIINWKGFLLCKQKLACEFVTPGGPFVGMPSFVKVHLLCPWIHLLIWFTDSA